MRINKEKFFETLNWLETHENNKANKSLEEAKEALEGIIRMVEGLLRESNSEFEENLLNSGINFEDIFDEIGELNYQQEIEKKEQEIFSNFFTFYYLSLVGESLNFVNDREKAEALISILETFREGKNFSLLTVYQQNEEKVEDVITMLKAISLSFDEPSKEEVIPSSSKPSKGKGPEKTSFPIEQINQNLVDEVLKRIDKDSVIELQKQIIEEKNKEIEGLKEEIKQLKLELENFQKEKLEYKTEFPPKK